MEDQLAQMEDRGLSGELDGFNAQVSRLRKEAAAWFRYYEMCIRDRLGTCHIGEVQVSLWDQETLRACEKAGITLL